MPQDPERTPLIRVTSPQGHGQNGESSPAFRSPGGVARILEFVRGDHEPSWVQSFSWIIFGSYFNVFLAFVPLSFVAQERNWDVLYRFGFSFFAVIPLAKVCITSSEGFITSSLVGVTDVVLFYCSC
jgi:Ca2+:H+ antiporter